MTADIAATDTPSSVIVLMGVSGCGKSSVGHALATRLSAPFIEADDYHPESNKAKMASGKPLTDDDRWPWLDALGVAIRHAVETAEPRPTAGERLQTPGASHRVEDDPSWPSEHVICIASCSALRAVYRSRLLEAIQATNSSNAPAHVNFVMLDVPRDVLLERLVSRRGHYMPPSLLESQLATLETPDAGEAVIVDADNPIDVVVDRILRKIL